MDDYPNGISPDGWRYLDGAEDARYEAAMEAAHRDLCDRIRAVGIYDALTGATKQIDPVDVFKAVLPVAEELVISATHRAPSVMRTLAKAVWDPRDETHERVVVRAVELACKANPDFNSALDKALRPLYDRAEEAIAGLE